MKYYEDGVLKKEGVFQRVVTHEEKIGKIQDDLHFNIKCGDTYEHLSREWTDEEWDVFTRDKSYSMPDPIIYDYIGGTYTKA